MSNLQLPTGFVSDITTNATDFLQALNPYTTMILGILLGAVVIGLVIGAIKH